MIAEQFLKSSGIKEFADTTNKRALIKRLVQEGDMEKPKLDLRTLEKFFVDLITPNQRRVRNIYSIYVFNQPYSIALAEFRSNASKIHVRKIKSNESKVNHFYNTDWFVYYYHYDESLKGDYWVEHLLRLMKKEMCI